MSAISESMAQAILNRIYRDATSTDIRPAAIYLALSRADPLPDGSALDEPTGNGYARVSLPQSGTLWSDPASSPKGQIHNLVEVAFPAATGAWGTITHIAVIDNGDNTVWQGPLEDSRVIGSGDIFRFIPGSLLISLA